MHARARASPPARPLLWRPAPGFGVPIWLPSGAPSLARRRPEARRAVPHPPTHPMRRAALAQPPPPPAALFSYITILKQAHAGAAGAIIQSAT